MQRSFDLDEVILREDLFFYFHQDFHHNPLKETKRLAYMDPSRTMALVIEDETHLELASVGHCKSRENLDTPYPSYTYDAAVSMTAHKKGRRGVLTSVTQADIKQLIACCPYKGRLRFITEALLNEQLTGIPMGMLLTLNEHMKHALKWEDKIKDVKLTFKPEPAKGALIPEATYMAMVAKAYED